MVFLYSTLPKDLCFCRCFKNAVEITIALAFAFSALSALYVFLGAKAPLESTLLEGLYECM